MKLISRLVGLFTLLLIPGLVDAQPQPPPSPFIQQGNTIHPRNPNAGLTMPSTVTGGNKGAGTINAEGIYINGAQVPGQTGTTPVDNNIACWFGGNLKDCGAALVKTIGANSIYMNATGVSAAPSEVVVPDCNGATKALNSTNGGGGSFWTCNSSITANSIAVGGITGLGTGMATFLATPSSANLAATLTDETGTGAAMFATGPTLGSVTLASLPSPGSAGRIYRVSNMGTSGSIWMDNGSKWKPLNGQALLATRDTSSSPVSNSAETCTFQYQLPAASWQVGDRIRVFFGMSKSGATDTGILRVHIGTAGTTSDTQLLSLTVMAASELQFARFFDLRLEDATHVQIVTQGTSPLGWAGSNSTNAYPATVAITNVSSSLFVSVCILSGGATNTLTNVEGQMYYISSAN